MVVEGLSAGHAGGFHRRIPRAACRRFHSCGGSGAIIDALCRNGSEKPGPLAGPFLLTLPLPAFDGWKGNMLIDHLPVPGNRSATSLCLMLSLSLIAPLSGCP